MSPRWEPGPNIRRGRSVIHNLHAHLVFVTKYRRGAFTDQIPRRCEGITQDVCAGLGTQLREFNGETDQVHYPPSLPLSTLVNSLQGVSSPRLRQEFSAHLRQYLWEQHFRSPSYFAGSCAGAPLSIIKDYIDQQKRPDSRPAEAGIGSS